MYGDVVNRDFGRARMQRYLDEAGSERFLKDCLDQDACAEDSRQDFFLENLRYLFRMLLNGNDLQTGTA